MNPLLLDFPSEFYTKRLFIRMPLPGDGKAVSQAINESIEELKPWMPFAQTEQTVEEAEINIRKSHTQFLEREDLRLLIFLKETGEFVGSSGLHRIDWNVPKFEIGYWINSRFSNKGYMTEAVEGIMNFALKELKAKRVEIRCDSNNAKSRAIPEKLGFRLEGILENDDVSVNGVDLRDTCIYAKVPKKSPS
ncbi:GNAT family N-acetyltransferase [Priestia megaterium]|uniref:GNAT family N-acetyltransferase n=1 Tax=Priestia megaterium TaxID=1404 RepID=UPI000BF52BB9|nr:GNAT family N-acetyltransferase [Priestia megaterium]PEU53160.1 GNAT family N-acetyltransferase [Priestia megaterium]